ncbi:MAG TPA: SDR family oxidoreductase [Flavobacteriaceae bacterium]|nr:SDR family oxidoreductase [Flavobacteriaceae bacterium]
MNIASKIAVVTGASSGLGAACSKILVQKGARVYGLARSAERLNKLHSQLGERFIPVSLDITEQNKLREWVDKTFSKNQSPNILINNAGAGYFGKIDEISADHWHQMINTNLNAIFYLTSALVPFMKSNESIDHIINIGSILGKTSGAEKSGYSATKYAIQGYSEALFKELRGNGIKVTCLNPGSIETHFFESSGIEPHNNMLQPSELAELVSYILETPDNLLIDELTVRPLNARPS